MIVLLLHDALLIPDATADLYKHTGRRRGSYTISRPSVDFRPSATDAVTLIQSTPTMVLTVSCVGDCFPRLTSDWRVSLRLFRAAECAFVQTKVNCTTLLKSGTVNKTTDTGC